MINIFQKLAAGYMSNIEKARKSKLQIRNSEGSLQFGRLAGIIYQMLILVLLRQSIRCLVAY